jgi:hypothetical protein
MDYSDPHRSVMLIDELVRLGMTQAAFSKLHHFGSKEKIASHRAYCADLAERGGRFTARTNQDTQRRMEIVLRCVLSGGFTHGGPKVFTALAEAAALEVPVERVRTSS